jgi:2-polyprenyl-6-methoxyphenol hydroxylase-like FAD-dependent oxidoreductase
MAYLTLFPIGNAMRANLEVYRRMDDPWLRQFREKPEATMRAMMPGLRWMTGDFEVLGPIKVRPADLYGTEGHRQAGIVLIGDAFATSCPAAGTGTDKVFTDVERLCNVHIPNWLASDGMASEKIAAFYDDPVKTACDAWASAKAYSFRSVSIDNSLYWKAQRWARFVTWFSEGTLRQLRTPTGQQPRLPEPELQAQPSSSSSSLSSSV